MNDEPGSAADAAARQQHGEERVEREPETVSTAEDVTVRRRKNREMFNKKRVELLDDLIRNLDILVYAELSAIYYMDCSFLRFFLRAFAQFAILTPKPSIFPQTAPDRPFIGPILGTALLSIIMHVWLDAPSAGEATRGYMHGGLAMDFIGQKGPSSKFQLLALDLLVIFLQLVQLAASGIRKKSKGAPAPVGTSAAQAASSQDADAEERGVRRSAEEEGFEMLNLAPTSSTPGAQATPAVPSSAEPPDSESQSAASDAPIFDAFHSGQIAIADLNLMKSLKEQFLLLKNHPPADDSARSNDSLRAELARRVLRLRLGRGV